MRVGIPRALLYYQYYPLWRTYFEELGVEVVVSPPTTQAMLAQGSARVVAETCLPAKLFLGHVLALVGKCDSVFIPVVRSMKSKVYNCSKFLGLPDMTRAAIPESPPVIDVEIDINKGEGKVYEAIYELGRNFTPSARRIRHAYRAGWRAFDEYRARMASQKLMPPEALGEGRPRPGRQTTPRSTIALVGHPYLLYDEYVSHRLISRLERAGCRVVTPEMVSADELDCAVERLVGRAYWSYEEEVVGAGGHYLASGVDGVIGMMAFGCGPDSLMMDVVRRQAARAKGALFMGLTLEEHTAEAGVVTRLEAFVDMLQRKKEARTAPCA